VRSRAAKKPQSPLDAEGLERLGLFYAGRYATTRARLAAYLRRKLGERGWAGPGEAPVERLVERFAGLGYVDDRAFASARAAALLRRGYGERRVRDALKGAGVADEDSAEARDRAGEEALEAAHRFARRRRLGPYAESAPGREARHKAAAAMVRAGHRIETVWKVLGTSPDDLPEPDVP
jgi:regulatory protein